MAPCQPAKHLHEMCRVWGGGGGGGPEFRVLHNSSWLPASAAGVARAMEGGRDAGGLADAKSGLDLSLQTLGSLLVFGGKRHYSRSFAESVLARTQAVGRHLGQASGTDADAPGTADVATTVFPLSEADQPATCVSHQEDFFLQGT